MSGTAFNLDNFSINPDGSYSKKTSVLQPRDAIKAFKNATIADFTKPYTFKEKIIKKKTTEVYFKNKDIKQVYAEAETGNYIYIPGNVPSLKNSKQIFTNKQTGKQFITSSELCKEYFEKTKIHWITFKPRFLKMIEGKAYPLTVKLIFIRDKHKSFDYGNISQAVLDCMTGSAYYPKTKDKIINAERNKKRESFAWVVDDDADHIIPNYSEMYGYDPKLAGVIIKVV